MFKFNFSIENDDDCIDHENKLENEEGNKDKDKEQENEINDGEYGLFDLSDLDVKYDDAKINESIESLLNNDDNYKRVYVNDQHFVETIQISKLNEFINANLIEFNKTHDLVSGKYEGGLKIWECSLDLSKYLLFNYDLKSIISKRKTKTTTIKILELGCGHALPILTLIKYKLDNESTSSSNQINYELYLQDFNRNCLETITYFNIKRNILKSGFNLNNNRLTIKFVYGDWKLLFDNKQLPNNYFDLILTSETIYNCLYYKSLLNLMVYTLNTNDVDRRDDVNNAAKKLKTSNDDDDDDDGKQIALINKNFKDENNCCSSFILLAAKTYYFGCGGNIHEFVELAKSNEYKLQCTNNLLVLFNNTCSSSSSITSSSNTSSINNKQKHVDTTTTTTTSTINNNNDNITPSSSSSLIDSAKEQQKEELEEKEKQEMNSISISREIIKLYY